MRTQGQAKDGSAGWLLPGWLAPQERQKVVLQGLSCPPVFPEAGDFCNPSTLPAPRQLGACLVDGIDVCNRGHKARRAALGVVRNPLQVVLQADGRCALAMKRGDPSLQDWCTGCQECAHMGACTAKVAVQDAGACAEKGCVERGCGCMHRKSVCRGCGLLQGTWDACALSHQSALMLYIGGQHLNLA